MEDFLYSALLGLVLLLAVFWFYFSYVMIPRIDKRMLDAGAGRACPVDIMGLRVFVIANAISLPVGNILNHEHDPFIDVYTVRAFANKNDKFAAFILTITIYALIALGVLGSFFLPEN